MDRQGVHRDDVALLREGTQIYWSRSSEEQIDHPTASLADEMIVRTGLGIESGSLFVQADGADLTFVDEAVKVAIDRAETDSRQLFVNPPVDLMGERVGVIALESSEHLLQLTCRTFAGGPPHSPNLESWLSRGSDRTVSECRVIRSTVTCQGEVPLAGLYLPATSKRSDSGGLDHSASAPLMAAARAGLARQAS